MIIRRFPFFLRFLLRFLFSMSDTVAWLLTHEVGNVRDATVNNPEALNALFGMLIDSNISLSNYSLGLVSNLVKYFLEYRSFKRFLAIQTDLPSVILRHIQSGTICHLFISFLSVENLGENTSICQLLDRQCLVQRVLRCLLFDETTDVSRRKAAGRFLIHLIYRLRYLRSIDKGNVYNLLSVLERCVFSIYTNLYPNCNISLLILLFPSEESIESIVKALLGPQGKSSELLPIFLSLLRFIFFESWP